MAKKIDIKKIAQKFSIRNLTLIINNKKIIEDVSFSISGKTALIGPNGSGKTMILSLLAHYITPTQGIMLGKNGVNMLTDESSKQLIGCMIQNSELSQDKTPTEELLRATQLVKGHIKIRDEDEILDLLAQYKIPNIQNKYLPHGKKQLVLLMLAMVGNPELLLLDEPFSGLDLIGRKHITELLQKYKGSMLITSHLLDEIHEICTDIVFIKKGSVIEERKVKNIKNMNAYYFSLYSE